MQASNNTPNIQLSLMDTFLDNTLLGAVKEEASRTLRQSTKYVNSDYDLSGRDSGDEEVDTSVKSLVLHKWFIKQDEAWRHVKPCQDVARKKFEILRLLRTEDMLMIDLKISLYITAANNNVTLKPFPNCIVDESPGGVQTLVWLNNLIPPLEVLKQGLKWQRYEQIDENVVNIVHWLLVQLRQPKWINLPHDNFDSVFQRVEYAINLQNPSFIVKIMVNNLSSNHLQWQAAKGKQATKFAFYATKAEHIHSLVHLGLYPFQKITGPFGAGIYLTSDLQTCLESSPPTWVWGKSTVGTQLQIVAVVEFIATHSRIVRYRDGKLYPTGKPYHYYVPYNNLMQARYLLIYVKDHQRLESRTLEMMKKRQFRKDIIHIGLLIGGYIALCCVAWKYLNGSNPSSLWRSLLLEKLKGNKVMSPLTLFIQPIKDII